MSKNKSKSVKPMLAGSIENEAQLNDVLPGFISPKLDGVRAMVIDNVVYSRNLKPIPNDYVQKIFGRPELNGVDGELIVGSPTSDSVYRDTVSGVMSEDGEPNVQFYVFDRFDRPTLTYKQRLETIEMLATESNVIVLQNTLVGSVQEFLSIEETWLAQGYEGVMVRDPNSLYKFGRASIRSKELLKFKRFADAEAEIVGVEELMSNQNVPTINMLGHTERSSHKENMVPMGTLGALIVRGLNGGFENVEFNIGSGFDTETRAKLWEEHRKGRLVGKIVKYKHFPIGILLKPRFPIYLGFRDKRDM